MVLKVLKRFVYRLYRLRKENVFNSQNEIQACKITIQPSSVITWQNDDNNMVQLSIDTKCSHFYYFCLQAAARL
jgi:hypothetical protein